MAIKGPGKEKYKGSESEGQFYILNYNMEPTIRKTLRDRLAHTPELQ